MKKLLVLLLCGMLSISSVGVNAYAAETTEPAKTEEVKPEEQKPEKTAETAAPKSAATQRVITFICFMVLISPLTDGHKSVARLNGRAVGDVDGFDNTVTIGFDFVFHLDCFEDEQDISG